MCLLRGVSLVELQQRQLICFCPWACLTANDHGEGTCSVESGRWGLAGGDRSQRVCPSDYVLPWGLLPGLYEMHCIPSPTWCKDTWSWDQARDSRVCVMRRGAYLTHPPCPKLPTIPLDLSLLRGDHKRGLGLIPIIPALGRLKRKRSRVQDQLLIHSESEAGLASVRPFVREENKTQINGQVWLINFPHLFT